MSYLVLQGVVIYTGLKVDLKDGFGPENLWDFVESECCQALHF